MKRNRPSHKLPSHKLIASLICLLFFITSCNRPATPSKPQPGAKLDYIKIGETIPELKAQDLAGQAITIASREDKDGQLIFIYSPTCDHCHATIPRWIELYRQFFAGEKIPVIGLSVLD